MTAPLGIIAGLGDLPVSLAQAARARGQPVYVVRLKGFVEPKLARFPGETVGLGEVGRTVKLLRAAGCEEVVFAGIVTRPDFSSLKLDWRGARLLPKVLAAARDGDDSLLRVMMAEFEAEGFRILGADQVNDGLLAPEGVICGAVPDEAAQSDIARGLAVARELGRLDIGQGCVVCDGLVLAVEAQEGTDRMLRRCAELDPSIRGEPSQPRGVLVKAPKPIQDRKIDLPTIGAATVEAAARAGLAGIAVEAGGALILDREAVAAACKREGLFVWGAAPAP